MGHTDYADAESLLGAASGALLREEAVNGLILGICLRLAEGGRYGDSPPFLWTAGEGSDVQLVAVMTPPYKLLLHTPDQAGACWLVPLADHLLDRGLPVPGVCAPEWLGQQFAEVWCERTGLTASPGMRQGIYELRRVDWPGLPPGHFRMAEQADIDVVRKWSGSFHTACFGSAGNPTAAVRAGETLLAAGDLFVWVDGQPVSMAARTRRTPNGQAVSHVYTPPEFRRRGYATATVASLSQRMLDEGREFCTLYTDLGNPTSNHIYKRIGYRPVGQVADIHFVAP